MGTGLSRLRTSAHVTLWSFLAILMAWEADRTALLAVSLTPGPFGAKNRNSGRFGPAYVTVFYDSDARPAFALVYLHLATIAFVQVVRP